MMLRVRLEPKHGRGEEERYFNGGRAAEMRYFN